MEQETYQRIAIDPKLHTEVKIAAAKAGITMKEFTEQALAFYMGHPRAVADSGRDYRAGDSTDDR